MTEKWENVIIRRNRKQERNTRRQKKKIRNWERSIRSQKRNYPFKKNINSSEKPTEVMSIVRLVPKRRVKSTTRKISKMKPKLSPIPEHESPVSPIKGKATKDGQVLLFGPW
jgi:hypothetical protein